MLWLLLSERSPFLFIVFILEVFHCERTMDLSLMHLQSTGSPSTPIKWISLSKIGSGHLALFGYMTLICFFNIVLSCSNNLTQVNNISNLSRRTKFREGYYCIAPQFFRFVNVLSAPCTGHIDTLEVLKSYHFNCQKNRPFAYYLQPLFYSKSWCSSFQVKISFHSRANEN